MSDEHRAGPEQGPTGRTWGQCICGWYGSVREEWKAAAEDADKHLQEVAPMTAREIGRAEGWRGY